jgi:transposase
MFAIPKTAGVYLYRGRMDMRKGVNGLSIFVQSMLKLDPFSGGLFVFFGRRRRTVKILYYDTNGFCLWYKRLEKDLFPSLRNRGEELEPLGTLSVSVEELTWLLKGLDIRQAHHSVRFDALY